MASNDINIHSPHQPQPMQQQAPTPSGSAHSQEQQQQAKQRRAFKACAHCRSRKAKCDLGDLSSPHSPPCARCRREGVECQFLPSRRGGRVPFSNQKRSQDPAYQGLIDTKPALVRTASGSNVGKKRARATSSVASIGRKKGQDSDGEGSYGSSEGFSSEDEEQVGGPSAGNNIRSAMGHVGSLASNSGPQHYDFPTTSSTSFLHQIPSAVPPSLTSTTTNNNHLRYPQNIPVPPPIQPADIFRYTRVGGGAGTGQSPVSVGNGGSDASPADTNISEGRPASESSSLNVNVATIIPPKKKRRRTDGGVVDPETLASANLRNPVDALDLLVLAADRGDSAGNGGVDDAGNGEEGQSRGGNEAMPTQTDGSSTGGAAPGNGTSGNVEGGKSRVPSLGDFPLVKKGVLSTRKLTELVDTFFSRMHFVFPICPHTRIPRTEAQLAKFASEELHLTTTFIVLASRHDKNQRVHQKSWAYLQTLINDIILGKSVSVGAVEALLLLSEYLPRQTDIAAEKINAEENRMSWMLVGTAVRVGYMLGLDQKTLLPAKPLSISTNNTEAEETLNRERVAWTYCYLFDRQISIRTGKAFWSRGPGLCFTGGAMGVHPTAAKNFPSLRFIPEVQDDFASLLQAYVEMTQIMTSANDCLFPSRERTTALVKNGEYYKFLDSFQQALEAFRVTWEGKRWATYPLTECIWITFHYLRLYIYAFAFQAHVQRATEHALDDDEDVPERPEGRNTIFPAGLVASPDAKFILEAIDAAADLLRLVCERLHPGGALPFLPWRIFMFISYAGVFLLKAVYVQAVATFDRTTILRLIKRLIFVLACASTDEQHPGVRYARLLNGLLRAFSQGQDSVAATRAHTPSRRNSVSGDTTPANGRSTLDFNPQWVINNSSQHEAPSTAPPTGVPFESATGAGHTPLPPTLNFGSVGPASPNTSMFGGMGAVGGGGVPGSSSNWQAQPSSTPAFSMPPFTESQPFHHLANSLDENATPDMLNFNFGLDEETNFGPPQPGNAFSSFLLEDSALDFFQSFDANGGDWGASGSNL